MQPSWTYAFFPDVDRNAWYAKYVCVAKINDIISGYDDGQFRPSNQINKAEAIKIIVTSQGYSIPSSVSGTLYSDVQSSDWFAPYVKVAMDKNLLESTGSSALNIGESLSRGGMSEMTYRSLASDGGVFTEVEKSNKVNNPNPSEVEQELIDLVLNFLNADTDRDFDITSKIDNEIREILFSKELAYVQNYYLIKALTNDSLLAEFYSDDPELLTEIYSTGSTVTNEDYWLSGPRPTNRSLMLLNPVAVGEFSRSTSFYYDDSKAYVGVSIDLEYGASGIKNVFTCYPFKYFGDPDHSGYWKLKLPSRFMAKVDLSTKGVIESCEKEIKESLPLSASHFSNATFSYSTPFPARIYLNGVLIKDANGTTISYRDTFLPLHAGTNTIEIETSRDNSFEKQWSESLLKEGEFEEMYELEPNQMKVQIDAGGETLVEVSMLESEGKVVQEFDYQP